MSRGAKIAVFAAYVLLASATTFLFFDRNHERIMRSSLEALTDRLAGELVVVHGKLDEAKIEIREAAAEKNGLLEKLAVSDTEIKSMRTEIAQLKLQVGRVDLGPLNVTAQTAGGSGEGAGASEGTVMSINRDHGFVIVNLGTQNGIEKGMSLGLHRDGVLASQLRVDMVDETICAAAILDPETAASVKVGDAVKF